MLSTPGVSAALAKADFTLPLPLAPERLAERGYNQALLLARALTPHGVHSDLLARIRHTPPLRAMTREQRLKSLRGAFAINPQKSSLTLRGRRVVLIDDVMTTGATLGAAANTLRAAGVAHITALVVARTGH